MRLNKINKVITNGFCLGCGLCHVMDENVNITEKDGNLRSEYKDNKNEDHISICPAAGYDIVNLGKEIHNAKNYSYELGWFEELHMAKSLDEEILKKASSGGAMTTIALYMLENGYADGVICTKYICNNQTSRPYTFIARNKSELLTAQGSKYCPTSTLSILAELRNDEKYVLIGTPCQVAGWRKYFKVCKPEINIVLTIANFCGGFRDFREIDHFIHNVAGIKDVTYFQHRGDGVPGQMLIVGKDGKEWKYPYPDYAFLSSIQKNKRCIYCIDATGELADISCGDVWLDRVKQTRQPWSSVILRNAKAVHFFNDMIKKGILGVDEITLEEVVKSQKLNITSKKYRQYKRMRIQTALFKYLPDWNGCIQDIGGTYYNECKILLSKFISSYIKI